MQQDRAVEADEKQQKAMLRRALDKAAIQEALARLVTKRNLPDKCVEWPEFHAVFLACNPAITDEIPSAHSHLTTIIDRTFEDHRQVLARHLQQARSNIHLTVDGWTSPNRKALLAICAHFIDDTYRMCKVLLALPELRNGKGGDEQAAVVIPVLEQYSIAEKIGFITSDNHGSNDILCLAVQNHLKTSYQLKWNAKEKRLRCQGHVINIAVKAFLFGKDKSAVEEAFRQINHRTWQADEESDVLMSDILQGSRNWREIGPLGKLHNIAVHIRSSEARYKTFRDFGASKTLGLDNDTRWNSWYKLIERAVELEMHVDRYTKEFHDSLRNDHLSPEDWMQLRDTRDFLAPFHRATLSAEGSFATLDQTILTMDILLEHFKLSKEKFSGNSRLVSRLLIGWYALDKYYLKTEDSPAYAAAVILNPACRKKYISTNWKKDWHKKAFRDTRTMWDSEYKKRDAPACTEQKPQRLDAFDVLRQRLQVTGESSFQDEYESYANADPEPLKGSPLDWWMKEENRERYPCLSKMAMNILSAPPMSAEPERVFSGARRTISWERMRLESANIEKKECLKSWIGSGITEDRFVVGDESLVLIGGSSEPEV
ncbi:hypothetical protein HIM_12690 [Hirsutella minnesotensis 3608]|uniref:HAT C-terminal dimerisation domain-containing protein n=1 Tax=Hirsutella minnesotensis 3608 TaxID=1043627 RepID=A0A0F7ZES9_9HYPO|nr:hypothetical protein HIM_12690 [Hirsutella minnesotensis 3608]